MACQLMTFGPWVDMERTPATILLYCTGMVPRGRQVSSPIGNLYAVTALTSNNLWAVGSSGPYSSSATLIMHWDGQSSEYSGKPQIQAPAQNNLAAVSAVSANDIWAVGSYQNTTGGCHPLSVHWDGTQWTSVTAPGSAQLQGISTRASNDVWAVGSGRVGAVYDYALGRIQSWTTAIAPRAPLRTSSASFTM